MKIKDLNGYTIEITNLNEAIQITRRYKQYEHENKGFSELDKKLNRYWTDMYVTGDLQITFRATTDNSFVLSVLLNNEQCGDEARKLIPPLNLRGTAEELDNGFFETISIPLQTASGLMVDMESFMKQLEEAKKKSTMEKEKSEKEKKEKEAKEKKYNEALQKAEELEKEGKYKEAWSALPKITEFPDFAETIRKKQDEYERHFAPSLFTENSTDNMAENQENY